MEEQKKGRTEKGKALAVYLCAQRHDQLHQKEIQDVLCGRNDFARDGRVTHQDL